MITETWSLRIQFTYPASKAVIEMLKNWDSVVLDHKIITGFSERS